MRIAAGELARLLAAEIVDRHVKPALQDATGIPVRFAMAHDAKARRHYREHQLLPPSSFR